MGNTKVGIIGPAPAYVARKRQLKLMYEMLELLRKETSSRRTTSGEKEFSDPKAADDWLFSELSLTMGDLDAIYNEGVTPGASKLPLPWTVSVIEGAQPIGATYDELVPFVGVPLLCDERELHWGGTFVAVYANIPGQPVLFTNADVPALTNEAGTEVKLLYANLIGSQRPGKDILLWSETNDEILAHINCEA